MPKTMSKRRQTLILKDAANLVNTSVQDMQSSLGCVAYSYSVLQKALEITTRRGEKTKALLLKRHINKVLRTGAK